MAEHTNVEHWGRGWQQEVQEVSPRTLGRLRVLRIADVELEIDGHKARVRGVSVHLPNKEFLLLRKLMENAGRVMTRRELLDTAWGPEHSDDGNDLKVHIRRIRGRIETDPGAPPRIRTVRGVGYVYDLPNNLS